MFALLGILAHYAATEFGNLIDATIEPQKNLSGGASITLQKKFCVGALIKTPKKFGVEAINFPKDVADTVFEAMMVEALILCR